MSSKHLSWAMDQRALEPDVRLALIYLADGADHFTDVAKVEAHELATRLGEGWSETCGLIEVLETGLFISPVAGGWRLAVD